MIELPSGPGPYRPDGTGASGRSRRSLVWLAAAGVLLLIVVVAVVNTRRSSSGGSAPRPGVAQPTRPSAGASTSPGGSSGAGPAPVARVACPQIRDEQSHLAYRCIDNYLRQDGSDIYLGLRIALNHQVEPGWVISEGSGDPTSIQTPPDTGVVSFRVNHGGTAGSAAATQAQVQAEVRRRTALALQQAYGSDPSSTTLSARARVLGGVTGYELVTQIGIDPAFRQAQSLNVRTERLWTVGLPSPTGVSIFMMSIPDSRRDLWPQAEATVGTVHVI